MNTANERTETSGEEDAPDKDLQEMVDDGPQLGDGGSTDQSRASSRITSDLSSSNSTIQCQESSVTPTDCSNNSTVQSATVSRTTGDSNSIVQNDGLTRITSAEGAMGVLQIGATGVLQTGPSTGEPTSPDIPLAAQSNVIYVKRPYSKRDSVPKSIVSAASKMNSLKEWSITKFKCTKQVLSERLGNSSKTVDPQLDAKIEALRDTQRRYSQLSQMAEALANHMYYVVQTQKLLGETFSDLAQTSPELEEEFIHNRETQTFIAGNGEILLASLKAFTSSLNTLCDKTMEDTLITVKQYEAARLEYDAHPRSDINSLILASSTDSATRHRVEAAKTKFEEHKVKFEKLRADLAVKLIFLEENKVQVMHKQLLEFHNAMCAYFSRFNIQPVQITPRPNSDQPSWLEQQ